MILDRAQQNYPKFYSALIDLKNNLFALKTGYEIDLWTDTDLPRKKDTIYFRTQLNDLGEVYLEYIVCDEHEVWIEGTCSSSDGNHSKFIQVLLDQVKHRDDYTLTQEDLQKAKLYFYDFLKFTESRGHTRAILQQYQPIKQGDLSLEDANHLTHQYRGLHRTLSAHEAKQNNQYYNNVLDTSLSVCEHLLQAMAFDSLQSKSMKAFSAKQFISNEPLVVYFAEYLDRKKEMDFCKKYMDSVAQIPKIFNEKLVTIADLSIHSTNRSLEDTRLTKLIQHLSQGFIVNTIMYIAGEKIDTDPKPQRELLIHRKNDYLRRKELTILHEKAAYYADRSKLEHEKSVLNEEVKSFIKSIKHKDLNHAQFTWLYDNLRKLVQFKTHLDHLPRRLIKSEYLNLWLQKPQKNTPEFDTWLEKADQAWMELVAQPSSQDKFENIAFDDAVYHELTQMIQKFRLKISQKHIPQDEVLKDRKPEETTTTIVQKSTWLCGLKAPRFSKLTYPKVSHFFTASGLSRKSERVTTSTAKNSKSQENSKPSIDPLKLCLEKIHNFRSRYFNGPFPDPMGITLRSGEGVFNRYLKLRQERHKCEDIFETCVSYCSFIVFLGLINYETMHSKRVKFVKRLEAATRRYETDPNPGTFAALKQIIHEELDISPNPVQRYIFDYSKFLSPNIPIHEFGLRLKATLRNFESEVDALEHERLQEIERHQESIVLERSM